MDFNRVPGFTPYDPFRGEPPAPRQAVGQLWVVRAALLFAGVVLPVISFLVVNLHVPVLDVPASLPKDLQGYAALLLGYPASIALSPFLLYCMISMGLVVFHPGQFDNNNFVRFGIFSGVLIAAEYCALLHSACLNVSEPLATEAVFCVVSAMGVLVPMGILWLDVRRVRSGYAPYVSILIIVGACLLCLVTRGELFLVLVFICLGFSTAWALAAYGFVSIRLIRASPPPRFRFSLAQLLAATTWFAAHCAAWRCAVLWALHVYSR